MTMYNNAKQTLAAAALGGLVTLVTQNAQAEKPRVLDSYSHNQTDNNPAQKATLYGHANCGQKSKIGAPYVVLKTDLDGDGKTDHVIATANRLITSKGQMIENQKKSSEYGCPALAQVGRRLLWATPEGYTFLKLDKTGTITGEREYQPFEIKFAVAYEGGPEGQKPVYDIGPFSPESKMRIALKTQKGDDGKDIRRAEVTMSAYMDSEDKKASGSLSLGVWTRNCVTRDAPDRKPGDKEGGILVCEDI